MGQHQANADKKIKDNNQGREESKVNLDDDDARDDLDEGPDKFNDALIYDEINIIESCTYINNNESKEKSVSVAPTSSISATKSSNSSSTNAVQCADSPITSYNSCGDSSLYEKDYFEVSYSRSISNNNTVTEERGDLKKVFIEIVDKENVAPGKGFKSIDDYVSLGVPRHIAEMKHPLENTWTYWYYMNDKSIGWEANNVQLKEVDTIEDFWQVYNHIEPASKIGVGCNYGLFKKGIWPDWSDFQNKYGGRWLVELVADCDLDIDKLWMETLFILIGEHGEPHNDTVNGAVINVRRNKFRIEVWLKDSCNYREGVEHIGRLLKRRLDLTNTIYFSVHEQGQGSKRGSKHSPGHFGKISV